jgi:hypothetical protein
MVPSPCFNNTLCVTAFVDLLPDVDHGSVVKAGLKWILALMPCTMLVVSGLLLFFFIVAMRGRVTLVALVVVVPPAPGASSEGVTDQHSFTMALRPQGWIPSGRHWMLPIELHVGQILQPLYLRVGRELLG